jgi:hypothetical protein
MISGTASLIRSVRPHDMPMKIQYIVLLILCSMLTACDRRNDGSSASGSASMQAQKDYDDQVKWQQAQHDAYEQQAKRANEQLRVQEEMHKRAEALLATQEQLLKRQQDDFARFEKILDTWETQQKQYQKYLDSLEKK